MNKPYSINPVTRAQYTIPHVIDDRDNIDAFLAKFSGRKVVVVQGLGFVGAVMALVCANAHGGEYAVIGVDLPAPSTYWKICEINAGRFPVRSSDPKVDLYFEKAMRQGNLYATCDPYAYSRADVVIVDVNLDVDKVNGSRNELLGYDVDLDGFRKAIGAIGGHCRHDALVLVESTVPPGTCLKLVVPTLRQELEARGLPTDQILVGHSYERVMPGPDYIDSIQNFYRVYAGVDQASADATEAFLRTIISTEKYPLTRLGNTNATEMAKVLENAYRAMNIAFMVEWSRFAEEAGVNLYEVVNAIRLRPTHSNIMFPGVGVGGYCLTKDALMASWARQHMFGGKEPLAQSEQGIATNDLMPWYAFEFIQRHTPVKDKKVLLLGVSYRGDVADTRFSPVGYLYRFLHEAGASISLHDPYVDHWEEMDMNVTGNLEEVLTGDIDIMVFSTMHGMYRNDKALYRFLEQHPHVWVFDTLGIMPEETIQHAENKRIRVLGRGDLRGR